LPRFCLNLALVRGSIAVGWAVAAATVLPLGLGDLLLGEHLWSSARLLLPPILLGLVFGCFEASAAAGVRGLGASRRSLAAQLSSSTLHVVLGITGTVLWGAAGSCWGVALGNLVGCGIWWWHLRRGTDEHIRNQGSVVI
jgi:Na+-driven multidrug efflux pump